MKLIVKIFVLISFFSSLIIAQVGPPTSVTPTNNAIQQVIGSLNISFAAFNDNVSGGTVGRYDFQFDSTNTFVSPLSLTLNVTATTINVTPDFNNERYYWRVRDADVESAVGNQPGPWYTYSFMTELALPVLSAPLNAATNISVTPTLSWTLDDSRDEVLFYIDYDTDGSAPWANTVGPFTTLSQALSGLSNSTIYFWRVRAVVQAGPLNAGETTSSSVFSFTTIAPPTLTSSTTSLTDFGLVQVGANSSPQNFTVSGSNLSANLVVTAPAGFEVSLTFGSGYGSSVSLTPVSGTVSTTTIYARFSPTAAGAASNNLVVSSTGATSINISVAGTGVVPTITTPITSLTNFGNIYVGSSSTTQNFTVAGSNLLANIIINAPTGFEVSTLPSSGFGSSVTLVPTGGTVSSTTVYARFTPIAAVAYSNNIALTTTGGVTQNISVTGTGIVPVVAASVGSLTNFGSISVGSSSAFQTFTVNGTNLTNNLVVNAPTGFEVSLSAGSGYGASVTLIPISGTVSSTTIYARFSPLAVIAYSSNIVLASTGATSQNVGVSGTGLLPPASINVAGLPIASFGSVFVGAFSAPRTFTISAVGLTANLLLTAPTGFEISTSPGSGYGSTVSLVPTSGIVSSTIIYVRFRPNAAISFSANVTAASVGATTQNMAVSGIGVTPPVSPIPNPPIMIYPPHLDSLVSKRTTFILARDYTFPTDTFQLELTPDPTFFHVRNSYKFIDSVFMIPLADTLQVGALMYWRVRGINSSGAGTWSPRQIFRVSNSGDTLPPTPFAGHPRGAMTVYHYNPPLTWWVTNDARNTFFDVLLSTSPISPADTPRIGGAFTFNNVAGFSQALTNLAPNTTFYWTARSQRVQLGDTVYGWWGQVEQFTTVPLNNPVVPLISYPFDNPMMYTRGVNLNWYLNDIGFGLTYDVQVAPDAGFTALIVNLTGVTQNFIRIIGTPGSTYYWRVRTNNGSATSAWSSVGQFYLWEYIPVPTVATPTIVYPVENATILGVNPLAFSWRSVDVLNAVTYDMQIWQGSSLLFNYTGLINNFHNPSPSLAPGVYQWRVRSTNGADSSAWSAFSTFTISLTGISDIPVLLLPNYYATVLSTTVTLQWFLNFNVAGLTYELQYATSQSGLTAAPIIPVAGGTNVQSHTIAGLVTGQIYYWRVRTTTGTPNPWSEPFYFVVNSNLGVPLPRIGGPGSNVNVISRSPELSWYTIGVRDGMRFTLQYSDNANFTNATTVENLTSRKLRLNNLNEGTTYYWRVRAIDGNNNMSSYSEVGSFRVINSPTSVEENEIVEIKEYSLSQNYPNPFNPSTMISYQIPVQSYVTLKIYDVLGNEVATLVNKELASGKYSVEFDASKLSTGIYVYRLTAGNFIQTRKMLLVK